MIDTADRLIAQGRENGRVCPQPSRWNELWEMLPNRRRSGGGWEPPLPLILEKMSRLAEHIQWAETHGALPEVSAFLLSLAESDWHHSPTERTEP